LRRLPQRHPRAAALLVAAAGAFFFHHASTLHVDADPYSYLDADHPLRADRDRLDRDLPGAGRFFMTLESNDANAFLEPRNVARLAEIQSFLAGQGAFDGSRSLADLLTWVHREVQGESPGLALPRTRPLIAQYLLMFHRTDLEPYVSPDFSRAAIVVHHN